jgi:hypothetical protein
MRVPAGIRKMLKLLELVEAQDLFPGASLSLKLRRSRRLTPS